MFTEHIICAAPCLTRTPLSSQDELFISLIYGGCDSKQLAQFNFKLLQAKSNIDLLTKNII